jgi:hypothetical protein
MARASQWTVEELQKPLIVVKLIFTGRTDNPEIQRIFAERMFEAFHGARGVLFGQPNHHVQQLTAAAASHAPPALNAQATFQDGPDDFPPEDDFSGEWLGGDQQEQEY